MSIKKGAFKKINEKYQHSSTNNEKKTNSKIETKLPKSEYESNGRPILNIDVDDINLSSSINEYLGQ